jgi:hypothetical protein
MKRKTAAVTWASGSFSFRPHWLELSNIGAKDFGGYFYACTSNEEYLHMQAKVCTMLVSELTKMWLSKNNHVIRAS